MLKLNKKSVKIISVVLFAIMMFMCFSPVVFAVDVSIPTFTPTAPGEGESFAKTILGVLSWISIVIAVGMMIFLGIKYVTSSPDGKADLKKQLGIYVLGLVFIVAASTIVRIIANAIPAA